MNPFACQELNSLSANNIRFAGPGHLSVWYAPSSEIHRMERLGAALRSLRVFHDLSQTQTAEKVEISKSFLSELESGKKEPTLALLSRYSQVFAVPLSSLLFFAEQMEEGARKPTASGIAPKVLRLLDWIAEVKPSPEMIQRKPPQKERDTRAKPRRAIS